MQQRRKRSIALTAATPRPRHRRPAATQTFAPTQQDAAAFARHRRFDDAWSQVYHRPQLERRM